MSRASDESKTSGPAHPPAARRCLVCEFARQSTQTVFGEGPRSAKFMLVGEVPGDSEDLSGRPFTGPAGDLLKTLLDELGVPLQAVYMTNAVKHFKYIRQGKRRLHQKMFWCLGIPPPRCALQTLPPDLVGRQS